MKIVLVVQSSLIEDCYGSFYIIQFPSSLLPLAWAHSMLLWMEKALDEQVLINSFFWMLPDSRCYPPMFHTQGTSHPPHFTDSGSRMIYSKTEHGPEENLCFLDTLCDSRALFCFSIWNLEGYWSFYFCYERATSSGLEEMLLRETAAEYSSESRKIRSHSIAMKWKETSGVPNQP